MEFFFCWNLYFAIRFIFPNIIFLRYFIFPLFYHSFSIFWTGFRCIFHLQTDWYCSSWCHWFIACVLIINRRISFRVMHTFCRVVCIHVELFPFHVCHKKWKMHLTYPFERINRKIRRNNGAAVCRECRANDRMWLPHKWWQSHDAQSHREH